MSDIEICEQCSQTNRSATREAGRKAREGRTASLSLRSWRSLRFPVSRVFVVDRLCGFEINRHDVIADADAELRDGDVSRVSLIRIERGPIGKGDDQARVVRAGGVHEVFANPQVGDAV